MPNCPDEVDRCIRAISEEKGWMNKLMYSMSVGSKLMSVLQPRRGGQYWLDNDQGLMRSVAGQLLVSVDTTEKCCCMYTVTIDDWTNRVLSQDLIICLRWKNRGFLHPSSLSLSLFFCSATRENKNRTRFYTTMGYVLFRNWFQLGVAMWWNSY